MSAAVGLPSFWGDTVITITEKITLAPIRATKNGLVIAHGLLPPKNGPFIDLVMELMRPFELFGKDIGCGIIAWSALQRVTKDWQDRQWLSLKYLEPIDVNEPPKTHRTGWVLIYFISTFLMIGLIKITNSRNLRSLSHWSTNYRRA